MIPSTGSQSAMSLANCSVEVLNALSLTTGWGAVATKSQSLPLQCTHFGMGSKAMFSASSSVNSNTSPSLFSGRNAPCTQRTPPQSRSLLGKKHDFYGNPFDTARLILSTMSILEMMGSGHTDAGGRRLVNDLWAKMAAPLHTISTCKL